MSKYQVNQAYWHESKVKDVNIAKEIHRQLLLKINILMCWGARDFIYMGDALKFKVNGLQFKGDVMVILNPLDYYDIIFGSLNKDTGEWILKHYLSDVPDENLVISIDAYVESGELD